MTQRIASTTSTENDTVAFVDEVVDVVVAMDNGDDGDDEEDGDGDGGTGTGKAEEQGGRYSIWAKARRDASILVADLPPMRWQGKKFAAQCVRQVLYLVGSVPEHFDVEKARKVGIQRAPWKP